MKAPAMATGAPNPAAPSMNAPKQNATSKTCRRRSAVIPATDSFMISNWPVSTENVIEINGRQHDPSYLQQTKGDAVPEAHGSQCQRHLEDEDGHHDGRQGARNGAPMWLHS